MALSFNEHALKLQRLENILAQTASPKVPEWPSYGNFFNVTQKPQKDALPEKAQKHTGANGIIL